MIDLLIIYLFTFLLVIIPSLYGRKINKRHTTDIEKFRWNKYYLFSLVILTLFLGTREGVGVDFFNYKNNFEYGSAFSEFDISTEIGYNWILNILHFFNFDYHSFFLVTSFLTVFLFFTSFKNAYNLLPLGIFIFFVGGLYNFAINGVRQGIAIMAFYNALQYLNLGGNNKDKLKNLFSFSFHIGLGALFHLSILFLIPLLLILNKKILSIINSYILIIIILIGFLINTDFLTEDITNKFIGLIPKYENYSSLILNAKTEEFHFGFISFFNLFTSLITVLFYDKIKKEIPLSQKYFVLFAIGTSLEYIFSGYLFIDRMLMYFIFCNIFALSYTFYFFKKHRNKYKLYLGLNIIIFCFFIVRFISSIPDFMDLQIQMHSYSLWYIPLTK